MTRYSRRRGLRAALALALLLGGAVAQAGPDALLRYELAPGEAARLGSATLRVFADGRLAVQRPAYWQNAGAWEARLSATELASLVSQLGEFSADGVAPAELAAARARRTQETGLVHEVSDPDVVTLELARGGQVMTLRFVDLQTDARRLPEHASLQQLAALERQLRGYLSRADLARPSAGEQP